MSARFFYAGKNVPAPFGPPRPIFCVGRKNQKKYNFLPIFLGGPWAHRLKLAIVVATGSRGVNEWPRTQWIAKTCKVHTNGWSRTQVGKDPPWVDSSKGPKPGE